MDHISLLSSGDGLPDEQIIERYLAGTETPDDLTAIRCWTVQNPDSALVVEALRARLAPPRAELDTRLDALKDRIRAGAQSVAPLRGLERSPKAGFGRAGTTRFAAIRSAMARSTMPYFAAAVVLVLGIVTYRMKPARHTAVAQRYQALPGQQLQVKLANGSRVILAPATTIDVKDDTVVVDGEAYFAVAPRSDRPFVVQTSSALVHVLGTRFVVRQYAADRSSVVVVEEGRVSLRPAQQAKGRNAQTILTARMMAQVTDSLITVPAGVAVDDYTGWIRGRLVFDETPLRDVIAELARAYGADIRVPDSTLAREPLTITVSVTEKTLPQVLDVIGLATGTRYTRTDSAFVLVPARGAMRTPAPTPQFKRLPQIERQYGQ